VPTTISDNAVEILSQIDSSDAIKASPSHNAAKAQMPVMLLASTRVRKEVPRRLWASTTKNPPYGGLRT
jgi:hypothetical protein